MELLTIKQLNDWMTTPDYPDRYGLYRLNY